MQSRVPASGTPHRQAGMSLVELLVALTLGAFITVGIIQMFTANQRTYQVNMGQARLQEGARFAMEFLARPIRMTGFTGCFSDNTDVFNVLNPVGGNTPYEYDLSQTITGHQATTPGAWSPSLDILPDDIDTTSIVDSTDVLVIKAVDTTGVRLSADMPSSSATIFTTHPDDLAGYEDEDILLISDCEKAAVFQITNSQTTAGGKELSIVHNSGGSTTPGNSQKELTRDGSAFRTDAAVYAVQTQIFYVAPGSGTNNRDDTPLSLWRKFAGRPPAELVEGIENLQVFYGLDTDGDRVPNQYREDIQAIDPNDIVTVRIAVTANSVDEVTDDGDGLLRRTFTKTIALRNRISRG